MGTSFIRLAQIGKANPISNIISTRATATSRTDDRCDFTPAWSATGFFDALNFTSDIIKKEPQPTNNTNMSQCVKTITSSMPGPAFDRLIGNP